MHLINAQKRAGLKAETVQSRRAVYGEATGVGGVRSGRAAAGKKTVPDAAKALKPGRLQDLGLEKIA
jgi:hypothetical protein